MDKLKQANLYRSELIPISGKLVARYNKCLIALGFTETNLNSFHIDGIGWSPEVAEEKETLHYLNNGEANLHGIIISPLQNAKPIYLPFHTFDRDIMKLVFKTYGNKIKDITRDCAICLDFDQGIDAFYEPLDVLKYNKVSVKFHLINNLKSVQKQQLDLVETFNKANNFIDESLHEQLLISAKTHGDLRTRDLELPALQYTTSSFYTNAFGGVYVLRDFIKTMVIFKDETWHREAIKNTSHDVLIYHIEQPELMDKLRNHMIIEYDLEKIVNTKRYDRIKKFEMSKYLRNTLHPIKDILNDPILFKSYLNKLDIPVRKKIMSVERYLDKMETSNQYKIKDIIPSDLFHGLHEPHSSLEAKHQDLIWKLLISISSKDILFWYWYDKEGFYKSFKTWNDSFKDWVVETITNNI